MKPSHLSIILVYIALQACTFDSSGTKAGICGNGMIERGEGCDDGNTLAGDGCSETCQVEPGWFCNPETRICTPICGDGRVTGTETCDDQNTTSGDGCSNTCQTETGWYCEGEPSVCRTLCGDGIIAGNEQCDDGNLSDQDGCNQNCRVETGFTCSGSPSVCAPVCGDGRVVGSEVCDGSNLDGQSCLTRGFYSGTLACGADCTAFDVSGCSRFCGDGILDTDFEECDGDEFHGNSCIKEGFPGGQLGCNSNCRLDRSPCHTWVQVATGFEHTCAVRSDHTLWCWGLNNYGQLGWGTNNHTSNPLMQQVEHLGNEVASVGLGQYHTCAVKTDGSAWCWGLNSSGQLGTNGYTTVYQPTPVLLAIGVPLTEVSFIRGGENHTCALRTNGTVWCWGGNGEGRLGTGDYLGRLLATRIEIENTVQKISVGHAHTCALEENGQLLCWGRNFNGQLGDGTVQSRTTPGPTVWPSETPAITDVSAGEAHTCVVTGAGAAFCFGNNTHGRLGNGNTNQSTTPVAVTGMGASVRSVAVGYTHSCAVKNDSSAWCWGNNANGRLGNGNTTSQNTPVAVLHMDSGVTDIVGGNRHTCGILDPGKLFCWGYNFQGQLGDGTTTDRTVATMVEHPEN